MLQAWADSKRLKTDLLSSEVGHSESLIMEVNGSQPAVNPEGCDLLPLAQAGSGSLAYQESWLQSVEGDLVQAGGGIWRVSPLSILGTEPSEILMHPCN
jgi:hypothetical protein